MTEEPKVYAWTPGKPGYESYPQYANFKVFADGRCVVTVRAPEFRTVGNDFYEMGETVCIQLPPDAAADLRDFFASVDTHAERCDVKQAQPARVGSAVAKPDAQRIPPMTSPPIGTDEELIARMRLHWDTGLHKEAADALQSRIAEVERLTALIAEMDKQVDDCCGCLGHVEPEFRARIDAALSQHRTRDE